MSKKDAVHHLRDIARQKTMMFTKATEDSPTVADACEGGAASIESLRHRTRVLSKEVVAWRVWFATPNEQGIAEREARKNVNEARIETDTAAALWGEQ